MYELQVRDSEGQDGWLAIHSGPSAEALEAMGSEMQPFVSNPLRVVERSW